MNIQIDIPDRLLAQIDRIAGPSRDAWIVSVLEEATGHEPSAHADRDVLASLNRWFPGAAR